MKINILLPYKEKFDENKASSVSITVKNNLSHSIFLNQIRIYGQHVEKPLFKDNFIGFKHSILSFKSKNKFLAHKMMKTISHDVDQPQLIEVHNRPYLIDQITKGNHHFVTLFLHNDPQQMKGSRSIKDRENLLKKCTAIFCVSEYIKGLYLEGISKNTHKVHVLYNGVNKKLKEFPKKKKEILFVGRLVPEKGAHFYVKALRLLAINFPEWKFGLIGSHRLGYNENKNSYAIQVINDFKKIGIQAKFFGFKNNEFVQEKMKTASIIVIPSIWQEPFGLVAAEAMSNGICIIASKVGGIPEIIDNKGILIKNINHKKLLESLIDLIKDNKKRECFQKKSWKDFKFTSINSSKQLDNFRKIIFQNF